jgi:hypothetical protein
MNSDFTVDEEKPTGLLSKLLACLAFVLLGLGFIFVGHSLLELSHAHLVAPYCLPPQDSIDTFDEHWACPYLMYYHEKLGYRPKENGKWRWTPNAKLTPLQLLEQRVEEFKKNL